MLIKVRTSFIFRWLISNDFPLTVHTTFQSLCRVARRSGVQACGCAATTLAKILPIIAWLLFMVVLALLQAVLLACMQPTPPLSKCGQNALAVGVGVGAVIPSQMQCISVLFAFILCVACLCCLSHRSLLLLFPFLCRLLALL